MNELEMIAGLPQTSSYRYAKRVGNQLFVAGQVPHDSKAELVDQSDPFAQANQCLMNLRKLLEVNGFSENNIQQIVIYVAGEHANLVNAWSAVEEWFNGSVPPATLLGVAQLGVLRATCRDRRDCNQRIVARADLTQKPPNKYIELTFPGEDHSVFINLHITKNSADNLQR